MSWCPQIYFLSCPHISRDVNPSKAQKEGTQTREFWGEMSYKTWMRRDHMCCVKRARVKNEQAIKLWETWSRQFKNEENKSHHSYIYWQDWVVRIGTEFFYNQSAIDGLEKIPNHLRGFDPPSFKKAGWLKILVWTSKLGGLVFSYMLYTKF